MPLLLPLSTPKSLIAGRNTGLCERGEDETLTVLRCGGLSGFGTLGGAGVMGVVASGSCPCGPGCGAAAVVSFAGAGVGAGAGTGTGAVFIVEAAVAAGGGGGGGGSWFELDRWGLRLLRGLRVRLCLGLLRLLLTRTRLSRLSRLSSESLESSL